MQLRTEKQVRELQEITIKTDTRDILSHATIQAEGIEDYFLVDIDAHVTETQFWSEIIELIDNDVIRQMGQAMAGKARHLPTRRCSTPSLASPSRTSTAAFLTS
jgi:phosphoribosyl-dephospho-CoA transferase